MLRGTIMRMSRPMAPLAKILQKSFKERTEMVELSEQVQGWMVRSDPENVEANKEVEHCFQILHQYL